MDVVIYPGSFDPVTNGHRDIIDRASKVFPKVIVSVLDNPRKAPMFTREERVEMLKLVVKDYPNVSDSFQDCWSTMQKNSQLFSRVCGPWD